MLDYESAWLGSNSLLSLGCPTGSSLVGCSAWSAWQPSYDGWGRGHVNEDGTLCEDRFTTSNYGQVFARCISSGLDELTIEDEMFYGLSVAGLDRTLSPTLDPTSAGEPYTNTLFDHETGTSQQTMST